MENEKIIKNHIVEDYGEISCAHCNGIYHKSYLYPTGNIKAICVKCHKIVYQTKQTITTEEKAVEDKENVRPTSN